MNHEELHRRIATRAYFLFLNRGGEHGHDVEDWLRAEAEIRKELGHEAATFESNATSPKKRAATQGTLKRGTSSARKR